MRTHFGYCCFVLVGVLAFLAVGSVASATTATNFTFASGQLQDNHVNGVFLYNTAGESSSAELHFDANWRHGVAKTSGDPTINPSSFISLSATQSNLNHRIRVGISAAGVTGTATFQTSLDAGTTWSSTLYTTGTVFPKP